MVGIRLGTAGVGTIVAETFDAAVGMKVGMLTPAAVGADERFWPAKAAPAADLEAGMTPTANEPRMRDSPTISRLHTRHAPGRR